MEKTLDLSLLKLTYRYEILLALVMIVGFFWWLANGTQAFVATFTVLLVLLNARNLSQYKRGTEDLTPMDMILGRLPFRYELLVLIAVMLSVAWAIAAGITGFVLGLGILMLALQARSTSQLKRNTASTIQEIDLQ